MTCDICGRDQIYHGSELSSRPGSYLSEAGCHNGCFMDDDEYHEGWDPSVVVPPCPYNPARCSACNGRSEIETEIRGVTQECEACDGTGWKDGRHKQPDDRYERALERTHDPED